MKANARHEQQSGPREHALRPQEQPGDASASKTPTPPNKSGQYEQSPDQTAEPDGQFPENPRGTLDDHQPGEDPVRGNDPNAQDASLAANEDGIEQVAGLRRKVGTSKGGR